MSQSEWFTSYLKYKTLEDMLKVILSSSQSVFSYIPMLYHINYNHQEILFIQTGMIGGVIIHYIVQNEKPNKKIIELKRLTGKFSFIDSIGTDAQSIYIPILELEQSTLRFPAIDSSSSTNQLEIKLIYYIIISLEHCIHSVCIHKSPYYIFSCHR